MEVNVDIERCRKINFESLVQTKVVEFAFYDIQLGLADECTTSMEKSLSKSSKIAKPIQEGDYLLTSLARAWLSAALKRAPMIRTAAKGASSISWRRRIA
jgi:hypothetical protein